MNFNMFNYILIFFSELIPRLEKSRNKTFAKAIYEAHRTALLFSRKK